jgi:hypothetical protein
MERNRKQKKKVKNKISFEEYRERAKFFSRPKSTYLQLKAITENKENKKN